MKRLYILILMFIFVFIFYLLVLFIPKNYTVIYKINDFEINETYFLEEKKYQIVINYNNQKYPLIFSKKYNKSRKIVNSIKEVIHEDEKCLSVDINEKTYPICYKNDNLVDFRLLTKEIQQNYSDLIIDKFDSMIDTYQSTNIYNYNNKKYYIWNYRGYDYLNDQENTSIKLFTKDNYYNPLSFKTSRYILTPNYDQEYYFNSFFVIDTNKEELYDLKLDPEISYSSYYLGEIKNDIYMVDKKNYIQYKININKNKIKVIGTKNENGIIYTDKWEDISLKKLVNKEYIFPKKENYNYQIIDEKLYLMIEDNMILLSNNKIKTIIYINNDEVYYLVGDVLYSFDPILGEVKLLENNEWNFNYENKIFIFD